MLISTEYTNKQRSKLNYFSDESGCLYPMKLEEEEEDDYEEIEELKKQQYKVKDDLLKKKQSEAKKIKKDTSN